MKKAVTVAACLIAFTFILDSCIVKRKKGINPNLLRFDLCNNSDSSVDFPNPYNSEESGRIASKRHFSGDTLIIQVTYNATALIKGDNYKSPDSGVPKLSLSPGQCQQYFLELVEIERIKMSSILTLYIELQIDGKSYFLIRDINNSQLLQTL